MFERIRSKILLKIGVLIAIETIFIISSFGVLAYFQSEDSSLGNSINIAGKNRYLTATALYEAELTAAIIIAKSNVNDHC
jgi:hypothetical protein